MLKNLCAAALFISLLPGAAMAASTDAASILGSASLSHKWNKGECGSQSCSLLSSYTPPPPFVATYPKEARLALEIEKAKPDQDLPALLDAEIADIKENLTLADYLEDDGHTAQYGIASWIDVSGKYPVAYMKYRAQPPKATAFTVIQAFTIIEGNIYYVHLLTFYGGHQKEVRADQQTVLKALQGL